MKVAVSMLMFCVAALLALGMVMLSSCSMARPGANWMNLQAMWGLIGLGFAVSAALIDYRILRKFALPLLFLAVALLALVLVPEVGTMVKGGRRWFNFGPIRFQPSELAKLALIITMAWYCERHKRHMGTWKKGILYPGLIAGAVLSLIFVEPDRGATVLLAAVVGVMLLVAGVQWKSFVPPVVVAVVAFGISLWHDPVRARRIFAWLNLEETKSGVGYQAYQSILAFGSGGWTGVGLGNSRQKHGFIPDFNTDFIFPVIGEELGLIATLLVVLMFVVIVCCGIYISMRSGDVFGMLLGTGLTFMIGFQAFINIGVVTGALPNKGLPLPFISYGGSNLLTMLTAVGLLVSIARRARAPENLTQSEMEPEVEPVSAAQTT